MSNIKARPRPIMPQTAANTQLAHQPEFKHNLIDLSVTPPNSVIINLGGFPLSVDYYNQFLGEGQEAQGWNESQTTPHQSYRVIKNVKLKLQSPMDYSMAVQTGQNSVSGVARIYLPGLVPISGDVFLADIGGGRLGRFEVRGSPRALSWFDRTAYEFEFALLELATINLVNQINERVVEKLNYIEEFIISGQNPIVNDETKQNYYELLRLEDKLTNQWLTESYSHEYGTLIVPRQAEVTYDPYIVNCAISMIDSTRHPMVRKVRDLNVDDIQTRDYTDLYSVLLDCDVDRLGLCFKEAKASSVYRWEANYSLNNIRYTGIKRCIYPVEQNHGVDAYYRNDSSGDTTGIPLSNDAPVTQQIANMDVFTPIGTTTAYVLSNAFYAQTGANETHIEKLTHDYLTGEALDIKLLFDIIDKMKDWSSVDRFYYYPIILILIRAAVKEISP